MNFLVPLQYAGVAFQVLNVFYKLFMDIQDKYKNPKKGQPAIDENKEIDQHSNELIDIAHEHLPAKYQKTAEIPELQRLKNSIIAFVKSGQAVVEDFLACLT